MEVVTKLDKSIDLTEVHPLNISSRLINEVASDEENLTDSNEVDPENILFI